MNEQFCFLVIHALYSSLTPSLISFLGLWFFLSEQILLVSLQVSNTSMHILFLIPLKENVTVCNRKNVKMSLLTNL